MILFQETYRVETARLVGCDYASAGWYHVVLCTKGRVPFFGEVRGGVMRLSLAGCILVEEWLVTPLIRPHVRLDTWVVMPDHTHGLLEIVPPNEAGVETPRPVVETPRRGVSTPTPGAGLVAGSLGAIIGQVKGATTRRIRAAGHDDFFWQPRFYDRVVRSERERDRTRRYISDNPLRWAGRDGRRRDAPP